MPKSRSSGTSKKAALALLALGIGLVNACLGPAPAAARGLLSIDIHDGVPYTPMLITGPPVFAGNFMTWVDTFGHGFGVRRLWFYHGGEYAESGVPYEVHFIYRETYGGGVEDFLQSRVYERSTTCNYCWEELEFYHWEVDYGSNEEHTFGVFIRPLAGGGAGGGEPRLWRDQYVNHTHLATLLDYYRRASETPDRPGDRNPYVLDYYLSDYGQGEILLGIEIESDVIVPTAPTSFSAIKSLY